MQPFQRVTAFARLATLAAIPAALLLSAAPAAAAPVVQPAAGAVLTAPPRTVTVDLGSPPSPGAQLEVWDEGRQDLGNGPPTISGDTLRVALPRLAPGIYTVSWASGGSGGTSAFTVWAGGALPPAMLRAAYGGPLRGPLPAVLGPCLLIALLAGLVGVGSLALPARTRPAGLFARPGGAARSGPPSGLVRLAGLAMTAACAAEAAVHTSAVVGVPVRALSADPLTRQVLLRGIGLDALVAAGLGLVAAIAGGRWRVGGVALGLALIPALLMVPAVQGGGAATLAAALFTAAGLGLYAGAWPHAVASRGWANPLPRLAGLILALSAGIPLFLRWHPTAGPGGLAAAGAALCAAVLGRPNVARRLTGLATVLGLGAATTLSPALAAASPRAGSHVLPPRPRWSYATAVTGGSVRLALSPQRVGVNVLRVTDPSAHGAALRVTLTDTAVPGLSGTLSLPRVAAGAYALQTAFLSQPGLWQATAGGATFQWTLGASTPAVRGCLGGFDGYSADVAGLGSPILALATDPGDGTTALAATAKGVFATGDGGRTWRPAGDPGQVEALAIGRYGEWFAATAQGLLVSQDGGTHWTRAAGPQSAVTALAAPLYPTGTPAWAISAGHTYSGFASQTYTTPWTTHWASSGPSPAGVRSLLALPGALAWQPVTLVGAGNAGLALSTDGGRAWAPVTGISGPLAAVAADAQGLWAAGPQGLFTAAKPQGPWAAVPLAVFGPVTGVATAGPNGGLVFAAVAGAGLLVSSDGGGTWTGAGCAGGTISVLVGTFARGLAVQPPVGAPLAYLGDAAGQVAALYPASSAPSG